MAKTLTLDITHKLFSHFFFVPATIIGFFDFCHFTPLLLTLTLPGGHKVNAKQNLLASFFSHAFNVIRAKLNVVMKQFKPNNYTETAFEQDELKQGK